MMKTIRWGAALAPVFLLAVGSGGVPLPTGAQEVERQDECRCVDRDGNEIERCTCLRMPDTRGLMVRLFGHGDRPRVGITLDPEQPSGDDAQGARVIDLLEDGPADRAGLREGDLVVRFDGHDLVQPLESGEEELDPDRSLPVQRLMALARRLEPGEEAEVEYLRDGERRRVTVEAENLRRWSSGFGSFPEMGERFRHRLGGDGPRTVTIPGAHRFNRCPGEGRGEMGHRVVVLGDACPGGLHLVELNAELGEYFGSDQGVLIADVHPDSPLGLQAGDVIQRIGEREVDTPDRARRIFRTYEEGESITFQIVRDGQSMEVQGRLSP